MNSILDKFPNVTDSAWKVLEAWSSLVREWNEKVNLISRKDIEYLDQRHLAHCLAITNHLKLEDGARILDVGTGGGFPGAIMAICYPQAKFTLIDSIGKKVAVVQDIVDRLCLKNVEVRQIRAEEVRTQFDFITGRAVKNLPEFFSWIEGNLRCGERHSISNGVLYWKGSNFNAELDALGIQPQKVICLQETFENAFFEQKYILHFDACDVIRAQKQKRIRT